MTRDVRFHPLATAEVVEAQLWYEDRVDGLGVRFLDAVRATSERAARWPNAGTPTRQDDSGDPLERKVALAGFPYIVVYRVASADLETTRISPRLVELRPVHGWGGPCGGRMPCRDDDQSTHRGQRPRHQTS